LNGGSDLEAGGLSVATIAGAVCCSWALIAGVVFLLVRTRAAYLEKTEGRY
jgi:hypothetical protein